MEKGRAFPCSTTWKSSRGPPSSLCRRSSTRRPTRVPVGCSSQTRYWIVLDVDSEERASEQKTQNQKQSRQHDDVK
ncbi:hypothetical protein CesoFtcFv8_009746 [Champsocephalus esox]|uniref:Uncharacterized protein n=1 Tax=Champsocephalus esox TaxID=159716 RepID=A0AAN8H255_9TELE|nr:hypothetical protein CesoFtcFv8_009746 [Champsocephalus esox]